jgi:RNA polymerase sigma-70 factor, ECF subfamily
MTPMTTPHLDLAVAPPINVHEEAPFDVASDQSANDAALLKLVEERDQDAMKEIFDRHSGKVYSVAWHFLRDEGQAEDVMQEVFFKFWQSPQSFATGRGSLRTWLMALARNRSIDVLRRRKPTEPIVDDIFMATSNLVSQAENSAMLEKVMKAWKDLPEAQQQLMYLSFFEELSHGEIAKMTGVPMGTIKTRIRLALGRLRKALAA